MSNTSTPSVNQIKKALQQHATPEKAQNSQRFFKTGKGQYGEGDQFIGVTVPEQRRIAKQFITLPLLAVEQLLHSKIHEHRLTALHILTYQYAKATEAEQKRIVQLYLRNTADINNWDLVDTSAPNILGNYLFTRSRKKLYTLARSKNMWEQRIAIIATYAFIRRDEYTDTLKIATILLHHEHDLLHKAVGWMLREVGKRDQKVLEDFLDAHAAKMPRTMLRYAIEKMNKTKKRHYMKAT